MAKMKEKDKRNLLDTLTLVFGLCSGLFLYFLNNGYIF